MLKDCVSFTQHGVQVLYEISCQQNRFLHALFNQLIS